MKGRSQRASVAAAAATTAAAPAEDWGDGAWTVDCSCGVTFDDGEEMVSCDMCGVWVHTRCARFVRGQPSFACHKCKASEETEETEVAQLLVELPTKAGADAPFPAAAAAPRRPPFRLWAEVPMEDRVHVQGVPGGDPALFPSALSSVFTSQLWRCAGYVPKKFNFKYKEFPCWEDEEDHQSKLKEEEEETENPDSRGADVLFSLSKEIVPYVPAVNFERRPSLELARKKDGGRAMSGSRLLSSTKKERSKLRVVGVSGKRRKDEAGEGKDRSARKKARCATDRAPSDDSMRGLVQMLDMNKADTCEDGGAQVDESNVQDEERKINNLENLPSESKVSSHAEGFDNSKKPKHILVVKASRRSLYDKETRQQCIVEAPMKVEQGEHLVPVKIETVSTIDASASAQRNGSNGANVPIQKEDVCGFKQTKDEGLHEGDSNGSYCHAVVDSTNPKSVTDDLENNLPGVPVLVDSKSATLGLNIDKIKVKFEGGNDQDIEKLELLSCSEHDKRLNDSDTVVHNPQNSMDCSSDNHKKHEDACSLSRDEQQPENTDRKAAIAVQGSEKVTIGVISRSSEPMEVGQVMDESEEYLTAEKRLTNCDKPITLLDQNHSNTAPTKVVGTDNVFSNSSAQVLSRSVLGSCYSPGITASLKSSKPIQSSKQQEHSFGKKVSAANAVSSEESMQEFSRRPAKDHQKSTICSEQKSAQMSSISNGSASPSKPALSDPSEKLMSPSSNAPTIEYIATTPGSGEASGLTQPQIASSSVHIKLKSSNSGQKNERLNQLLPQTSTKVLNHSTSMHPPAPVNATTTLSDEELALLLHQELNSSPRVPRVPRVRQAGGMQLTSLSGTSMLSKRSSLSGVKEHVSVSRRKNKEDGTRDSSRNSHEVYGETKRMGRLTSSHDQKYQDLAFVTDGSSKGDAQNTSQDNVTHVKKNSGATSIGGSKGSTSSSLEANEQRSPQRVSSNDIGLAPHTLPGLIGDIIKKHRDITLEELCDAVRPRWHNLRKPNGDRYAYSSHSHAVLDCLRNRSEWSHLIGRGPKTNSNKRRRKFDPETPTGESENEEARDKESKWEEDKNEELHREDFPKGKRKARKRRRPELRGRAVKDSKRRRQGAGLDDDYTAFSHSSNEGEGPFSEDESQGTGLHGGGAEASSSSDDDAE